MSYTHIPYCAILLLLSHMPLCYSAAPPASASAPQSAPAAVMSEATQAQSGQILQIMEQNECGISQLCPRMIMWLSGLYRKQNPNAFMQLPIPVDGPLIKLVAHPTLPLLLTVSQKNPDNVQCWSTDPQKKYRCIATIPLREGDPTARVTDLAISPNGKSLFICGTADGNQTGLIDICAFMPLNQDEYRVIGMAPIESKDLLPYKIVISTSGKTVAFAASNPGRWVGHEEHVIMVMMPGSEKILLLDAPAPVASMLIDHDDTLLRVGYDSIKMPLMGYQCRIDSFNLHTQERRHCWQMHGTAQLTRQVSLLASTADDNTIIFGIPPLCPLTVCTSSLLNTEPMHPEEIRKNIQQNTARVHHAQKNSFALRADTKSITQAFPLPTGLVTAHDATTGTMYTINPEAPVPPAKDDTIFSTLIRKPLAECSHQHYQGCTTYRERDQTLFSYSGDGHLYASKLVAPEIHDLITGGAISLADMILLGHIFKITRSGNKFWALQNGNIHQRIRAMPPTLKNILLAPTDPVVTILPAAPRADGASAAARQLIGKITDTAKEQCSVQ